MLMRHLPLRSVGATSVLVVLGYYRHPLTLYMVAVTQQCFFIMEEIGDMAAVATRIKARLSELATERALVELVKSDLEGLLIVLDEEIRKSGTVRRSMLSTVRARHGVELELWKVREQQEAREAKVHEYQREADETKNQANELLGAWEEAVKELYVDHDLQRELYKRSVQGRIQRRQQRVEEREQRLRQLEQESKAFENEAQLMVNQTKQLEQKILDTDDREAAEDEEVAAIAMQIRATVANRTSLRRAVRDAEEACQKASKEMTKWEQKRMELTDF